MKILFEENKTENSVRIYQANGINKTRIASFDLSKKKIVLAQVYRKDLEKRNMGLKEVSSVLLSEYNNKLQSGCALISDNVSNITIDCTIETLVKNL